MPHEVHIEVDGRRLRPPVAYSIDIDLLQPADALQITLPMDAATDAAAPLDAPYAIYIDGTPQLTGFIDSKRRATGTLTLQGRDRTARLVDTSVPGAGMKIQGMRLSDAILKIVRPWYTQVSFSNAADRQLRRGHGSKARASREPSLTAAQAKAIPTRIAAGTPRQSALERVLEPLGLLSWGAGDGKTLVVSKPQFAQAPQYELVEHPTRSTVKGMSLAESVQSRYATIVVSGSGRPAGTRLKNLSADDRAKLANRNRLAIARDTTGHFRHPKRLFVAAEKLSLDDAQAHADRLMRQGLAQALTIDVEVPGHGQHRAGSPNPVLYAPDTVAHVEYWCETAPGDDTPYKLIDRNMYVTRVSYRADRQSGEVTSLSLSPLDVELV